MRDHCPPFLAEAEPVRVGSAFLGGQYTGNLYGRDRVGHTAPDAEVHLAGGAAMSFDDTAAELSLMLPTLNSDIKVRPNEMTLPVARVASKSAANLANYSRISVPSKSSNSYNAATVR